jgi:hypothetical protein
MDHPAKLGSLVLCLALAGCASTLAFVERPFRKPGERLRDLPEQVWQQYDCDTRTLPFFALEQVELHPQRLRAGGTFAHRMVYALCPPEPTAVVTGILHTRIKHRGTTLVDQGDPQYDLKPGRWVVDAFVELPPTAEIGVYALEIEFEGSGVHFDKSLTFAIDAPAQ